MSDIFFLFIPVCSYELLSFEVILVVQNCLMAKHGRLCKWIGHTVSVCGSWPVIKINCPDKPVYTALTVSLFTDFKRRMSPTGQEQELR